MKSSHLIFIFICLIILYSLFKPSYILEEFKSLQADQLLENGYLIIPNVVSIEECDDILSIIDKVESSHNDCGNIHSNYKRKDMMIPVSLVKEHIKNIYCRTKDIWKQITPNAILTECSSLISYPGSYPQIWHTDTSYKKGDANLVSIGVMLKDTDKKMGPLNVYKKSNKLYKKDIDSLLNKHDVDSSESDASISDVQQGLYKQTMEELCIKLNYKKKECTGSKGDLVVWLSSVVHRGGANNSNTSRPVFYFSLLSSRGTRPQGSTYSLIKQKKKIHLKQL
jgi:hypothetical protein